MKRIISCVFFAVVILLAGKVYSQNPVTLNGHVKNSKTHENLPAVSVTVKGTSSATFTNENGTFKLVTAQKLPFTLVISSIGYANKEVQATSDGQMIEIEIDPSFTLGQDIVVAASRVPERILESPVSIERVSSTTIRQSPASSYYDVIGNLKGVDMTTSSLTFKTPSTRGFNGSGNTRFNQLVDGMDNEAPGLNFSVGAVIGLTELDVDNMELLSGASSALYGSGGMNGTLLINSKDPFKYQGVSLQVKEGVMNINNPARSASVYNDYTFRWAQKLSEKVAFRISAQYIEGNDWVASDSTNYNTNTGKMIPGTRITDPNYNGVNVYGDETSVDIRASSSPFIQGVIASLPQNQQQEVTQIMTPFLNSSFNVSRTGYKESDIIDPQTKNIRISGGLFYKINDKLTASFMGYYGTGNTVYTGADRFALKNLQMGQYKFELKSKNWFVHAYTTQENSGDAFDATVNTQLFNEAWKPSYNPANAAGSWYPQYAGAFVQGAVGVFQQVYAAELNAGQSQQAAAAAAEQAVISNATALNNAARSYADVGRPVAGTAAFNQLFNQVAKIPIPNGGHFLDRSDLYDIEGQYNFTDALGLANKGTDILAGASWKQYVLNSQGTLFADTAGKIHINEVGAYLQASQKFFSDVLKLTASGRYDKSDNFKGRVTPRFSAVIKVAQDQNFRVSFQTAYRFPSTQNQYINLKTGSGILIGGLPSFRDFYHFNTNPVYTLSSFQAFAASGDPTKLQVQQFGTYKPESSSSFEVGYKGLFANKILLDVYSYYGQYKDFLGRITVLQSSTGTAAGLANPIPYSISVNSSNKVNTYGYGFSLEYLMMNNFYINTNFYSDDITNVPVDFDPQFNTPKYRFNFGFGNSGFGKNKLMGFNVIYRWQDAFNYTGDFISGPVAAFGTIDAQVSYKVPKAKLLFKLGGTNILNHYYMNAAGNPSIGALYYLSIGYNVF